MKLRFDIPYLPRLPRLPSWEPFVVRSVMPMVRSARERRRHPTIQVVHNGRVDDYCPECDQYPAECSEHDVWNREVPVVYAAHYEARPHKPSRFHLLCLYTTVAGAFIQFIIVDHPIRWLALVCGTFCGIVAERRRKIRHKITQLEIPIKLLKG